MDSYVDSVKPTKNYGDVPYLKIQDTDKLAFVKLDIHRPKWRDKTIVGTLLRIWVPAAFSSQTVTVKRVTKKWKEHTIDFNNKPNVTATGQSSGTVSADLDEFWEIDIDTIFADWIDNSKAVYGVQISTDASTDQKLYSSEARKMFRPELLISWS